MMTMFLHQTTSADMVQLVVHNCDVVAVACNAHIMHGSSVTHDKVMGGFAGQIRLKSALQLIEPYFSIGPKNPAPFSGYMYTNKLFERYGDGICKGETL